MRLKKIKIQILFLELKIFSLNIFDNMALYFECRIYKKAPSDCLLVILPTGLSYKIL